MELPPRRSSEAQGHPEDQIQPASADVDLGDEAPLGDHASRLGPLLTVAWVPVRKRRAPGGHPCAGPSEPPANLQEMIARDRALGGREPVPELCATSRFGPDGRYIGPVSSSDSVGGYTLLGAMRLPYSAVTQPVLAIATMRDVRDLFPDIAMMDSADSARATVLAETVQRELDAARARLRRASHR